MYWQRERQEFGGLVGSEGEGGEGSSSASFSASSSASCSASCSVRRGRSYWIGSGLRRRFVGRLVRKGAKKEVGGGGGGGESFLFQGIGL